ncbi:MAG: M1 family metallopeptidase [Steroidobacteraceae bacterium]
MRPSSRSARRAWTRSGPGPSWGRPQTATFVLSRPLTAGRHRLSIDYAGRISTQPSGLFALDYTLEGAPRRALFTQFEPADARRVFPGWDEPARKASFTLHLVTRDAHQQAIANMPESGRESLGDGRERISFAPSPRMSSYLLFFALGEFDRKAIRAAGTEVAVVTKRGDLDKTDFALSAGQQVTAWYNDYFAMPYPLPKLDLVAAPGSSQFFGAMENWGAIFYFEKYLLLDPRISSVDDRRAVFEVVAHEVAHQWFGDLVTMGWWDDLWLNEGFASWMADHATQRFHPEWNLDLAAVEARESAIHLDALASTHAIVQHIESEALNQAFDSITYSKGSSILRMLEQYVSPDAWRRGVQAYVRAHAYGSTRSDDLWSAVGAAANKPVTTIARQFTLQPGVPLIHLTQASCQQGRTVIELKQGEFQMDRVVGKPRHWAVPVTVGTGSRSTSTLVDAGSARLSVEGCGPVVVNRGQVGYFRTLYEPAAFERLRRDYAALASVDQLGILSDAWAFGMTGQQPTADALGLVQSLPLDAAPEVWQRAARIIETVGDYDREDPGARAALLRFASARLGAKLEGLGWELREGEPDNLASLRDTLIAVLGGLGDPRVVAEARRRFDADATEPIPGGQRQTILRVVAANADAATWERLHAMARSERTPLIRTQLYSLLGTAHDATLAQRALELALSGEPPETDAARIIDAVSGYHPALAFDFAVAHASQVAAKIDSGAKDRFIVRLASESHDPGLLPRLRRWADANVPRAGYRAVDTVVSEIRYRHGVHSLRIPAINEWLGRSAAAGAGG